MNLHRALRYFDAPADGCSPWVPTMTAADLAVTEYRVCAPSAGERRLLSALLDDAVRCYKKYVFSGTRRGRRLFGEVEAWFTDPELDVDFTYEYVCAALRIDAAGLRTALERWRAGGGAQPGETLRGSLCEAPTGTDG